jgi:hypothetical protein
MPSASAPSYFRRPWGPGWALVGEAGYHKDSTWPRPISAFHDAELLGDAPSS